MQVRLLPHVAKRLRGLRGSAQGARVVPLREQSSAAPEPQVQILGQADAEPLHTARELAAVGRFDDEMHVVRLHGVLDDAKHLPELPRGAPQYATDGGNTFPSPFGLSAEQATPPAPTR